MLKEEVKTIKSIEELKERLDEINRIISEYLLPNTALFTHPIYVEIITLEGKREPRLVRLVEINDHVITIIFVDGSTIVLNIDKANRNEELRRFILNNLQMLDYLLHCFSLNVLARGRMLPGGRYVSA